MTRLSVAQEFLQGWGPEELDEEPTPRPERRRLPEDDSLDGILNRIQNNRYRWNSDINERRKAEQARQLRRDNPATAGNELGGIATGLQSAVLGLAAPVARVLGASGTADDMQGYTEALNSAQQQNVAQNVAQGELGDTPVLGDARQWVNEELPGAVRSLSQVAALAAVGGLPVMTAGIAASTADSSLYNARQEGVGGSERLGYAAKDAAAEVLPMLAFQGLGKFVPALAGVEGLFLKPGAMKSMKSTLAAAGIGGAAEVVEESGVTVWQAMNEAAHIPGAEDAANWTGEDGVFLSETAPMRQKLIDTLSATAAMVGLGHVVKTLNPTELGKVTDFIGTASRRTKAALPEVLKKPLEKMFPGNRKKQAEAAAQALTPEELEDFGNFPTEDEVSGNKPPEVTDEEAVPEQGQAEATIPGNEALDPTTGTLDPNVPGEVAGDPANPAAPTVPPNTPATPAVEPRVEEPIDAEVKALEAELIRYTNETGDTSVLEELEDLARTGTPQDVLDRLRIVIPQLKPKEPIDTTAAPIEATTDPTADPATPPAPVVAPPTPGPLQPGPQPESVLRPINEIQQEKNDLIESVGEEEMTDEQLQRLEELDQEQYEAEQAAVPETPPETPPDRTVDQTSAPRTPQDVVEVKESPELERDRRDNERRQKAQGFPPGTEVIVGKDRKGVVEEGLSESGGLTIRFEDGAQMTGLDPSSVRRKEKPQPVGPRGQIPLPGMEDAAEEIETREKEFKKYTPFVEQVSSHPDPQAVENFGASIRRQVPKVRRQVANNQFMGREDIVNELMADMGITDSEIPEGVEDAVDFMVEDAVKNATEIDGFKRGDKVQWGDDDVNEYTVKDFFIADGEEEVAVVIRNKSGRTEQADLTDLSLAEDESAPPEDALGPAADAPAEAEVTPGWIDDGIKDDLSGKVSDDNPMGLADEAPKRGDVVQWVDSSGNEKQGVVKGEREDGQLEIDTEGMYFGQKKFHYWGRVNPGDVKKVGRVNYPVTIQDFNDQYRGKSKEEVSAEFLEEYSKLSDDEKYRYNAYLRQFGVGAQKNFKPETIAERIGNHIEAIKDTPGKLAALSRIVKENEEDLGQHAMDEDPDRQAAWNAASRRINDAIQELGIELDPLINASIQAYPEEAEKDLRELAQEQFSKEVVDAAFADPDETTTPVAEPQTELSEEEQDAALEAALEAALGADPAKATAETKTDEAAPVVDSKLTSRPKTLLEAVRKLGGINLKRAAKGKQKQFKKQLESSGVLDALKQEDGADGQFDLDEMAEKLIAEGLWEHWDKAQSPGKDMLLDLRSNPAIEDASQEEVDDGDSEDEEQSNQKPEEWKPEGTVYASGLTRSPADIETSIARNEPVGVSMLTGLSQPVRQKLSDYANNDGKVFLDSGAFTAFQKGKEVDWKNVMFTYKEMVTNVAKDKRSNVTIVAPDIVGDPEATYALQEEMSRDFQEITDLGAKFIIPVQRGENNSLASGFADQTNWFNSKHNEQAILGVPFNAAAWSQEDVLEYMRNQPKVWPNGPDVGKPFPAPQIHLLGGGLPKVQALIKAAEAEGLDVSGVGGDALQAEISARKNKSRRDAAQANRDAKKSAEQVAADNDKAWKERVKRQEEQASAEKAEYEDIDGFADDKPAMKRGAARKVLNKVKRYDGTVKTAKQMIRDNVAKGWYVEEHAGKDYLTDPKTDESWNLNKTEADYAQYLQDRPTPAPTPTPAPQPGPNVKAANERSERTAKELKEKLDKLKAYFDKQGKPPEPGDEIKSFSGLDPEGVQLVTELTVAAINHGISKFNEYVAFVKDGIGSRRTREIGSHLERMWKVLGKRSDYQHIDQPGKVADILGEAETETESKSDPKPDPNRSPDLRLADAVEKKLTAGETINGNPALFAMADAEWGGTRDNGTYGPSDAYDAVELGVNKAIIKGKDFKGTRPDITADEMKAEIKKLDDLIKRVPNQTNKSNEKDKMQQFSTPPAYGAFVAWAANPSETDVIVEPSAGTGDLAVQAGKSGAKVYVNEKSERRAALLEDLAFEKVFQVDAEYLNDFLTGQMEKPTVVVMNPPFSVTLDGAKKKPGIDLKHVDQAMKFLQPGGRLVAIVGAGLHGPTQTYGKWLAKAQKEFDVRATVEIPRGIYKGYGTTFPTRLLIIDKRDSTGETLSFEAESLDDAIDQLEVIRNDRQEIEAVQGASGTEQQPPESTGVQEAGGTDAKGTTSGRPTVRNPVGTRGSGQSATPNAPAPGAGGTDGVGSSGSTEAESEQTPRLDGVQRPESAGDGETDGKGRREDESSGDGAATGRKPVVEPSGNTPGTTDSRRRTGTDKGDRKVSKEDAKERRNKESVYDEYEATHNPIKGAKDHPAKLVQTAAMASVESPATSYVPDLTKEAVSSGRLSAPQIEGVTLAGAAHEKMLQPVGDEPAMRRGFMFGDGTGAGKTSEFLGVIMDNQRKGRKKAIIFSPSQGLLKQAQGDWQKMGQDPKSIFNPKKADKEILQDEGVLFMTYGVLAHPNTGVDRVKQIDDWVGKDFDGVIVFDEAHVMSNIAVEGQQAERSSNPGSKRGLAGLAIQKAYPKARVVYMTATAATEVKHMMFADRLGLWGPGTAFPTKAEFVNQIKDEGVAAMEFVARDMKAAGSYVSRTISFEDVEIGPLDVMLTDGQKVAYNRVADAWQVILQNVDAAIEATGQTRAVATKSLWGMQQRFFSQLMSAMQTPKVIQEIEKDLKAGKSPIVQVINTGGAALDRALTRAGEDQDSIDRINLSPLEDLMHYVESAFPIHTFVEAIGADGETIVRVPAVYPAGHPDAGKPVENQEAVAMRDQLLEDLMSLTPHIPNSPLDQIIDHFGTELVAEVSGRKERLIYERDETGRKKRVKGKRSDSASANEGKMFQQGKKNILIISKSGHTGYDFHDIRGSGNERQRSHYLLEYGWSATGALQGMGRSHRSNQASAPIYRPVRADIPGQKRFIATIMRRFAQLGALTRGESKASGSDGMFDEGDNLETPEAKRAMDRTLRQIALGNVDGVTAEDFKNQTALDLLNSAGRPAETNFSITQVLNRLSAMHLDAQNALYDVFEENHKAQIAAAKADGTFLEGVKPIRGDRIEKVSEEVVRTDPSTGAETKYIHLKAFEPLQPYSMDQVKKVARTNELTFYRGKRSGIRAVIDLNRTKTMKTGRVVKVYETMRPNGNRRPITELDLESLEQVERGDVNSEWETELSNLPEYREQSYHMVTGSLLPVWDRFAGKAEALRTVTDEGESILGRSIPPNSLTETLRRLGARSTGVEQHTVEGALAAIRSGGEAELSNGWRLKQSRVQHEQRIEIVGPTFVDEPEIRRAGGFKETVASKPRYFIPANSTANAVLKRLTEDVSRDITSVITNDSSLNDEDDEGNEGSGPLASSQKSSRTRPEGRKGKAKNATEQEAEDTGPVSHTSITKRVEKIWDVTIKAGRVVAGADGQYQQGRKNKRTGETIWSSPHLVRLVKDQIGDLGLQAHELAHHIDEVTDMLDKLTIGKVKTELRKIDYKSFRKNQEVGLKEGFAEFLRHWLSRPATGPQSAAVIAPDMTDYFNDYLDTHPELAKQLEDTRKLYRRYYEQTPQQRAESQVRDGDEPERPTDESRAEHAAVVADTWFNWFEREFIDQNAPLKKIDELARKAGYLFKDGMKTLRNGAYDLKMSRMYTVPQHVEQAMMNGVHSVDLGVIGDEYVNGKKTGKKGVKGGESEILSMTSLAKAREAAKIKDDDGGQDYTNAVTWMYARFTEFMHKKDPEYNSGLTVEDARAVLADTSAEDAARYEILHDGIIDHGEALLEMKVRAGLMSRKEKNALVEKYPIYFPLLRIVSGKVKSYGSSAIDVGSNIRRRSKKGSDAPILDPMIAMLNKTAEDYKAVFDHQVLMQLRDQANKVDGLGGLFVRVPPNTKTTKMSAIELLNDKLIMEKLENMGIDAEAFLADPDLQEHIIYTYRKEMRGTKNELIIPIRVMDRKGDMKIELWEVDEHLYRALEDTPDTIRHPLAKFFGKMTKAVRTGAIGLNPAFGLGAAWVDLKAFQERTRYTSGTETLTAPVAEALKYFASLSDKVETSDVIKLFLESGGLMATQYGHGSNQAIDMRDIGLNLTPKEKKKHLIRDFNRKAVRFGHYVESLVAVSDVGPRIAEFVGVLRSHGYTQKDGKIYHESDPLVPKRPPQHVLIEATMAASEATVNFKRRGRSAATLNQFIPFFTASLASMNKQYKMAKVAFGKAPTEGNRARVLIANGAIAMLTVMYWAMRRDDDDYQEQEDWLKYGYWTTTWGGKPVIRIPRGYEEAVIPNLVEGLLNQLDPASQDGIAEAARESFKKLIPPHEIAGLSGVIGAYSNWDSFRQSPIENQSMEGMLKKDRDKRWTTEFSKWASAWGGSQLLNLSPAQIDHIIEKSTGSLGTKTLTAVEGVGRAVTGGGTDKLVRGLKGLSPLNRFVVRKDYNESVTELYERSDEVRQQMGSMKKAGKEPDDELKIEQSRINRVKTANSDLRDLLEGVDDRDDRFAVERYIIGLSRWGLGKRDLKRYENPLNLSGLPENVKGVIEDVLVKTIMRSVVRTKSTDESYLQSVESARAFLADTGITKAQAGALLTKYYRGEPLSRDRYSRKQQIKGRAETRRFLMSLIK